MIDAGTGPGTASIYRWDARESSSPCMPRIISHIMAKPARAIRMAPALATPVTTSAAAMTTMGMQQAIITPAWECTTASKPFRGVGYRAVLAGRTEIGTTVVGAGLSSDLAASTRRRDGSIGRPNAASSSCRSRLSALEMRRLAAEGAELVDVRPVAAFSVGHVPGALSIELRSALATWLGWPVPPGRPWSSSSPLGRTGSTWCASASSSATRT